MTFRDRAIRELVEAMIPEHDPTLTTANRLLEFMSTNHLFSTLGVSDVWLSSDGDHGFRLEINIRGWGIYQSVLLLAGSGAFPWLDAEEAMDLRAAAEHICNIVARVVEGVARDAERYVHEAIATYRVVVQRPGMTQTLAGGPEPRTALVTALGALSLAAAELDLDFSPSEARDQLDTHGRYALGPLSVTVSLPANWDPAPRLRWRPVVAAPDRILGRDLEDSTGPGRT